MKLLPLLLHEGFPANSAGREMISGVECNPKRFVVLPRRFYLSFNFRKVDCELCIAISVSSLAAYHKMLSYRVIGMLSSICVNSIAVHILRSVEASI